MVNVWSPLERESDLEGKVKHITLRGHSKVAAFFIWEFVYC